MATSNWRDAVLPETRQLNLTIIRDKLIRYQCFGDVDGLLELKKFAQSVEEKAYAGATSESDYLEKITLAMQLIDTCDWRVQLHPDSRQRIVNKIMDTLKRHLPVSGEEGLHELHKIAQRFEEKIFTAATSQSDYLRKISLKMLTMETKSQGDHGQPSNHFGPPDNQPAHPADMNLRKQSSRSKRRPTWTRDYHMD